MGNAYTGRHRRILARGHRPGALPPESGQEMPAIADRLRDYATAIGDPTRGLIVAELDRAGELTATQLARRLDLTANNVYHHMRVLLQLGVVDPPRAVPGDTYVEKYYRISPEVHGALRLDPEWYPEVQGSMTLEDRQAYIVTLCLSMAHLLRRAALEYQRMDPAELNRRVQDEHLVMLSIKRSSREELKDRMLALQNALYAADPKWAEDVDARTDVLLVAGLPSFRDD
jgi:DNA-binding transcriptional ArsR family regulator